MDERIRNVAVTVVAIAAGALIAIAMQRQASAPLPLHGPTDSPTRDTRFEGVRIVGRNRGQTGWRVTAPSVTTAMQGNRVVFDEGIEAELYQHGLRRVVCQAPRANYQARSDELIADGGVEATLEPAPQQSLDDIPKEFGAVRLATNRIRWVSGSRLLQCPEPTSVRMDQGRVDVRKLDVDIANRNLDAVEFRGRFRIEESEL